MLNIRREPVYQPFDSYAVTVNVTPTQLSNQISLTKSDLIDSFILSLDTNAANNVFIGGQGVTINNGLEIIAGGGPIQFIIENQKQQYEVQAPVLAICETLQCTPQEPIVIPFIIWDFSQIYLVAPNVTNIRCTPFRSMFI